MAEDDRVRGFRKEVIVVAENGQVITSAVPRFQFVHTNVLGDTFITEEGYVGLEHSRDPEHDFPSIECATDCQPELEMIVQIDRGVR